MTGPQLRRLRRRHRLTQEQMAKILDLRRNTLIRYEGGHREITRVVAAGIVCLLEHRGR